MQTRRLREHCSIQRGMHGGITIGQQLTSLFCTNYRNFGIRGKGCLGAVRRLSKISRYATRLEYSCFKILVLSRLCTVRTEAGLHSKMSCLVMTTICKQLQQGEKEFYSQRPNASLLRVLKHSSALRMLLKPMDQPIHEARNPSQLLVFGSAREIDLFHLYDI